MSSPNLIALAWLALAVVLEILANLSLKWSDGLRRPFYGALSVAMVLGAFTCLAQAVRYIDLAVAYALWGGLGMVLTLLLGWVLFRQRLNRKGWAGLGLLLTGIALMKLA